MNSDNFAWGYAIIVLFSPYLTRLLSKRNLSLNDHIIFATILGILGTFLGIFAGLLEFNVDQIMESVPQLLSGLKLAFVLSIAGMTTSILLRTFPMIYAIKIEKVDKKAEENNVGFIINSLKSIESNQREFSTLSIEQMKKIEVALCGEGDTTLLTQIQKLRTINPIA